VSGRSAFHRRQHGKINSINVNPEEIAMGSHTSPVATLVADGQHEQATPPTIMEIKARQSAKIKTLVDGAPLLDQQDQSVFLGRVVRLPRLRHQAPLYHRQGATDHPLGA
jgi:hypothetical protein